MDFDVKSIQVWSQSVIEVSVAFVKEHHTILMGVLSFLFPLYLFFPSLFFFFVFAVPVFTFIAFAFRLIFRIHQENLRLAKGENYNHVNISRKITPNTGSRNLDRKGRSYAHAQSVRRRNSKIYENQVHFKKDLDSTTDNHASVDKAVLVEETPKEIREVENVSKTDRSIAFGDGSGLRPARYSSEGLLVEGENSDDGEDDEEEAPGSGNDAVEWTEDDQKNLMDLGFSEMERNKRLESLIAKRKAKKLLSLQVRRSLMDIGRGDPSGEMGSFMLPNMGVFPKTKDEALMSPTPGSAPSVLVPLHNPFDIPYDPQEEKPNLTGGFQEELVEPHPKDPVFCKHQSFNWGTTYQAPWNQAGTSHGPNLPIKSQAGEIPELAKLKKHLGKEELNEQMETKTSQQSETKPCTDSSGDSTQQHKVSEKALNLKEVDSADGTIKVEDVKMLDTFDIQETGSSSSSEIIAPFTTANKDEILKSLSFSMRKNIPLPEIDSNARREGLFYNECPSPFNYTGMYGRHTPSCSIASDMHVEVSEASSQISNFSLDEGSPKFDDTGDLDVEGISENLEDWVAPPLLKKVEENETRLGEVREVSEQDVIKVGFSKINQDIEKPIIPKSNRSCSSDSSNKVHKEVQPPKEPSNSVESTTKNAKTTKDMNDKVELVNDDQGMVNFIQHTYGENSESMNQGTSQGTSAPTLNKDSKPVDVNAGTHTQQENTNSKVKTQSEPAKAANELSFTGKNIHVRETIDQRGPSKASSRRSAKCVRKVKSFRRPETPLSPCTTPNSSKFYLMANLSFDDAYVEPQQSNMETEGNSNVSKDSQAVKNHAGDSVGSQESSSPAGSSIVKDKTSHERNDVPIDEKSSGHGLVQTSITGGDVGLQTPVVNETINEAEEVGKLESSKDKEGHPKLHSTINNLEPVGVIKSDSGSVEATRKSEAEHIGKDLILPGDSNTQVTEVVGENGTSKASSSTSPGPSVKESSIPLGRSTGENNASMTDTGQQISKKENEKTETVKDVEEIGKLEKSKDVENHSKLHTTIENSEPTRVVKNDSGNVEEVKRKSEPENAGQGSELHQNNSLRIRELIARNSFRKGSSPSSPGPGLKEPNNPFANSTIEDKTSLNMKDRAISESVGGGHVHSTVPGDEGSQTSAKENEKTEIIKGAEEIGKLEKSKDFESHSEPIGVMKGDSKNVVEVKSKSEPKQVGKGLNSTGDSNINFKEAVPGNGLSKASLSTSPRPIKGTEDTGTVEKSKDIETQSKLYNTVVSSEPIGVLKGDSGNVGDAKRESEPDNLGKGLKSSGDGDINVKEAVPENGLSKANSSTSPKTMKGAEEIGKLEKIKDIESPSKLHNTIDNSEPIGVTKSDPGNLGEVKSNSDSKHVDKGLDSVGDSTIKVSDSGHENVLRQASSSTSPEPIKGAEEIGKLEKPTDIESDSKLQNTVVNSELTGVTKIESGNVGDAKSKSEPEIVGKGLSLIGDSNVKGKESVLEIGLSDSSKSPELATKEPSVPLGIAATDKTSHNINDSSKPVEVPKSNSGNAGELGSNIHDRKVLAENGTDNASVSTTSPEPVTKESSFPLGSSSVEEKGSPSPPLSLSFGEEKTSNSMKDRGINEGSEGRPEQTIITQTEKGLPIPTKGDQTETIKGVEEIGKLEKSKDVEVNSKLHNTIDNSGPSMVIKTDSGNIEEAKRNSGLANVDKGLGSAGDSNIHVGEVVVENNSTKAISSASPEPALKEPSILSEKPEKLVSSVDSVNAPYTSISSNKGQNNQVGVDSNLAKPIEPCMSPGNEINAILVKPEVMVEQVNVAPGPSSMTNSTQIDSIQKEAK